MGNLWDLWGLLGGQEIFPGGRFIPIGIPSFPPKNHPFKKKAPLRGGLASPSAGCRAPAKSRGFLPRATDSFFLLFIIATFIYQVSPRSNFLADPHFRTRDFHGEPMVATNPRNPPGLLPCSHQDPKGFPSEISWDFWTAKGRLRIPISAQEIPMGNL